MDIQFYGANCVRLSTKKASVVIDDNLADLGLKAVTKPGDVAVFTTQHGVPAVEVKLVVDQPGEYEVSDVSVQGIAARAHIDEPGTKHANMFKITAEDVKVAVVGHVYPDLNANQLEDLGTIDVLIIPVGGNGYTLDPIGALKLIKAIEPKIVIPTHYDEKGINYPVPQQPLEEALKGLSMDVKETVGKLKVKHGEMGETAHLIVLEKQ